MKVITFGELMIRIAPSGYERFFQSPNAELTFGGSEANVAVSLAGFGLDSAFVTKLPEHAIGQAAVNSLRYFGVDTSSILRGGDRVGIYFVEKGASQRSPLCIYDRAHSAIAEADPAAFEWDTVFEGADWFHFSGITPALGPNVAEACRLACAAAKKQGVKVSCDLNYRAKLWTREAARKTLTELCSYVDVCIANEGAAKDVFGIEAEASAHTGKERSESVAAQLTERFGFEKVALTMRASDSASENGWAGMLHDDKAFFFSPEYRLHIIDRIGGGDAFSAGLIYRLLTGKSAQETIDFAVAASALKHTVEGDFNRVTVEEVEALAAGDASGMVKR